MRIAIVIALMAAAAAIALACGGNAETPATPDAPQPTVAATAAPSQTAAPAATVASMPTIAPAPTAATAAPSQTAAPAPTIASATTAAPSHIEACADETAVDCMMEVSVGPERVYCEGSAPMMCMMVDGDLFYDDIDGFEHEAGYRYRLRMERYDRWPGQAPPADASKYGYRLIEVVEKARAAQ